MDVYDHRGKRLDDPEPDEGPQVIFFRQKIVTTRKVHRCAICERAIPVGGLAEYTAILTDDMDRPDFLYTCPGADRVDCTARPPVTAHGGQL